MRWIILCGGRGERFPGCPPKPLNRVCGRQIGEWLCTNLLKFSCITELIWVLNPKLKEWHIEEEIIRWTKGIPNQILWLPFETRDASETLEIALSLLTPFAEPFVCLDNDNIYTDALEIFPTLTATNCEAAILVRQIESGVDWDARYGFLQIQDGLVVAAREKQKGWRENAVSLGAYWFASSIIALEWLTKQRTQCASASERSLLTLIATYAQSTKAVVTQSSFSIGTPEDCRRAEAEYPHRFGWSEARLVVDLDNTLVTYPTVYNDYETSHPIVSTQNWIKDKASKGAEIIIASARRMKTYNNNIAAVVAATGLQTLNTIAQLELGETEVHFGKPNGDIYLDDKALNPYTDNWKILAGDWQPEQHATPMNCLPITRAVTLTVKPVYHVFKSGSIKELQGQAAWYAWLQTHPALTSYFPRCYNIIRDVDTITLELENIRGVPASFLWCYGVWGEREWNLCIQALSVIHDYPIETTLSTKDALWSYIPKTEERMQNNAVLYELLDPAQTLWSILKERIKDYQPITPFCYIHGDYFLGNIIFPMKGGLKMIDMKGELDGAVTMCGDRTYDHAKLVTSFLGMDSIVYEIPMRPLEEGLSWISRLYESNELISLALVLMYGSISFYKQSIAAQLIARIRYILTQIA